jgi:hypothetical protein
MYTWPDGRVYDGNFANHKCHGRGVLLLADGARFFDGEWREDTPLRGSALESDGSFFLATFDGKITLDDKSFNKKRGWIRLGRVEGWPRLAWKAAGARGGVMEWTGMALWADGRRFEGRLLGLRPLEGMEMVPGGERVAVAYGGATTLAEIGLKERRVRAPKVVVWSKFEFVSIHFQLSHFKNIIWQSICRSF